MNVASQSYNNPRFKKTQLMINCENVTYVSLPCLILSLSIAFLYPFVNIRQTDGKSEMSLQKKKTSGSYKIQLLPSISKLENTKVVRYIRNIVHIASSQT